jgi:hypothetical protein
MSAGDTTSGTCCPQGWSACSSGRCGTPRKGAWRAAVVGTSRARVQNKFLCISVCFLASYS